MHIMEYSNKNEKNPQLHAAIWMNITNTILKCQEQKRRLCESVVNKIRQEESVVLILRLGSPWWFQQKRGYKGVLWGPGNVLWLDLNYSNKGRLQFREIH